MVEVDNIDLKTFRDDLAERARRRSVFAERGTVGLPSAF
ncbi:hypothetical protein CHELA20_50173 [Hyphomicrobiales bacterium]|nr:hypothetical protein CHELA41_20198 [Hyphomicrobiales bacterium]CAH1667197.1 hypothetical protein CHELA20_50173 [Hyphomicrobiales bacterium]